MSDMSLGPKDARKSKVKEEKLGDGTKKKGLLNKIKW
jgi:hypothetical protein